MLLLGEKDSLSSKDFMPSLPRIMSTKLHCKATFPLHPRSFINTVQDQPVFSAHSSMKSYISFHLANTHAFIRGQREGSREEALQQSANFTGQDTSMLCIMKCLAPFRCDASRHTRYGVLNAQLWRRFPADMEPLRTRQQPGRGTDYEPS